MLERFGRIYDELRLVAEDERFELAMNLTTEFKSEVSKYKSMLEQLDHVTKFLQKEHLSLSDCRIALETLSETVNAQKENSEESAVWLRFKRYFYFDVVTSSHKHSF